MKGQFITIITFLLILYSCKHRNIQTIETADTTGSIVLSLEPIYGGDSSWAENEFKRDAKYGLMLIRYGLPDETDRYFWEILEYEYGIEKKMSLGCTIGEGVPYYNDLMKGMIKKKYGDNFFHNVEVKVDSIYKIDKVLIEKIKAFSIIDTSNILNYIVYNTPDNNIKVVCGYGWRLMQDKPWYTNLFRISIDRREFKILNIDTTQIGEERSKN